MKIIGKPVSNLFFENLMINMLVLFALLKVPVVLLHELALNVAKLIAHYDIFQCTDRLVERLVIAS